MCLVGSAELPPFRLDFLRPHGRPPLDEIDLRLSCSLKEAIYSLLPVLRKCHDLHIDLHEQETDLVPFDAKFLVALLAPGASFTGLNLDPFWLFKEPLYFQELANCLRHPFCRLERLSLIANQGKLARSRGQQPKLELFGANSV